MAEDAPPDVAGLGKAFAEFALLPDLLWAYQSRGVFEDVWTSVLEDHGFNEGHVHRGDFPGMKPGGLVPFTAQDAQRMCERLRLLDPEGELTAAGRRVAQIGEVSINERRSEDERAAAAVVGEQLREHYVGADGLQLVPLLQEASARLADAEQPSWAVVRGLVLAEFDTVLYRGLVDAERARGLPEKLPRVRDEIVGRLERSRLARGGLEPDDFGPGTLCDAVTFWHYEQDALAAGSTLSLTELRVTAMAMTWSGLLSEEFGDFEISVLAPVAEVA